ncbi:hypothetical protein [Streptosporangium sp. NPDC051022]|uniref:hypothetical protein n=1 Tax=Streptosporangium sp. NPDC051022 TaxID=3155752 RepID=UPI0034162AE1
MRRTRILAAAVMAAGVLMTTLTGAANADVPDSAATPDGYTLKCDGGLVTVKVTKVYGVAASDFERSGGPQKARELKELRELKVEKLREGENLPPGAGVTEGRLFSTKPGETVQEEVERLKVEVRTLEDRVKGVSPSATADGGVAEEPSGPTLTQVPEPGRLSREAAPRVSPEDGREARPSDLPEKLPADVPGKPSPDVSQKLSADVPADDSVKAGAEGSFSVREDSVRDQGGTDDPSVKADVLIVESTDAGDAGAKVPASGEIRVVCGKRP